MAMSMDMYCKVSVNTEMSVWERVRTSSGVELNSLLKETYYLFLHSFVELHSPT